MTQFLIGIAKTIKQLNAHSDMFLPFNKRWIRLHSSQNVNKNKIQHTRVHNSVHVVCELIIRSYTYKLYTYHVIS